jgi:hypothetical protein
MGASLRDGLFPCRVFEQIEITGSLWYELLKFLSARSLVEYGLLKLGYLRIEGHQQSRLSFPGRCPFERLSNLV